MRTILRAMWRRTFKNKVAWIAMRSEPGYNFQSWKHGVPKTSYFAPRREPKMVGIQRRRLFGIWEKEGFMNFTNRLARRAFRKRA